MSIFNIKLKTKNGNDIKKKETFTVFFSVDYKKNAYTKKVTAEYTYRIIYSGGIDDPKRVLELRNSQSVESLEDLTLKVILNFCHIIGQISQRENIDPDFVLFMSLDFNGKKNKSWTFLKDVFNRPKKDEKVTNFLDRFNDLVENWTNKDCEKLKIKLKDLEILRKFVEINPNTVFMTIDPMRDKQKYSKSIAICYALQDRIDRAFTNNDVQLIK